MSSQSLKRWVIIIFRLTCNGENFTPGTDIGMYNNGCLPGTSVAIKRGKMVPGRQPVIQSDTRSDFSGFQNQLPLCDSEKQLCQVALKKQKKKKTRKKKSFYEL